MNKVLFAALMAIIIIVLVGLDACMAYRKNGLAFKNLYGFTEESVSIKESLAWLTNGIVKFLFENSEFADNEPKEFTPTRTAINEEYDFIVVGGGTAGATVASRLSEIKSARVLLIEAGSSENIFMDIPLLADDLQLRDDLNWKYQSERSDSYCQGMRDQVCNWPSGKVMGGSSVLNYMIASRGIASDYDKWAGMGNDGWSYEELLKYFKKLEHVDIKDLRYDTAMHGSDGPVHINYPPYHTPLAESFLEAGLEMNYPIVDYNGNRNIGFSYVQSTMARGTRVSTNRAYLGPASHRKNLYVSRLSHVNRVLVDTSTKRAYGVEFTKITGLNCTVRAIKEIILCAGTVGSAQILMLSGIGPAEHLNQLGIDVIQDSPVGENLMDHIAYGGLVFLVDQPVSITKNALRNPVKPYLRDFYNRRKGPYTVPGGCEALAFIDTDYDKASNEFPNMELLFVGKSVISDRSADNIVNISNEYWDKMFSRVAGNYSWTILPTLLRPNSRGKVLLRDKDPRSRPRIIPNYLADEKDVEIMIEGIRAAIEISKTKAMRRFNSRIHDFLVPGCQSYRYDSNDYWECALRTFTFSIYDYTGTCKMGPESHPTTVVNPKLQVKGIRSLRVADASIMPTIVSAHTNIPVIMIAEKLSDIIKKDWGYEDNFYSL